MSKAGALGKTWIGLISPHWGERRGDDKYKYTYTYKYKYKQNTNKNTNSNPKPGLGSLACIGGEGRGMTGACLHERDITRRSQRVPWVQMAPKVSDVIQRAPKYSHVI